MYKSSLRVFVIKICTYFKSLHIISFVAWMAGLLYLPRLFVYHADEKYGIVKLINKFCLME